MIFMKNYSIYTRKILRNLTCINRIILLYVFLCIFIAKSSASCGFGWESSSPVAFANVGYGCNLVLSEHVGDITLSDGTPIRLLADFDSAKKTSSQLLGHGWFLNLTDITVIPSGQNTYTAIFPGGWQMDLTGNGNLYKNPGWVLEIKGDKMILSQNCGMSITFKKGTVQQFKNTEGVVLDYKYDRSGRISQINDKDKALVKFHYDDDHNSVSILAHNSKRPIMLYLSDTGKEVAGKTLKAVETQNGDNLTYEFGRQNGLIEMTRFFNGAFQNSYAWDPKTGALKMEYFMNGENKDSYSYFDNGGSNSVDIKRKRTSDGNETWMFMDDKGIEKSTSPDGTITVINYIPYGVSANKIRRKTVKHPDGTVTENLFHYDDKGRLVREIENRNVLYYVKYDDSARKVSYASGDGKRTWDKFYDEKGRLVMYRTGDGKSIAFAYAPDGGVEAVISYGSEKATRSFSADDLLNLNISIAKKGKSHEK